LSTDLLEKTQAMIEVERLLTITMEKVEPWLASNNSNMSVDNNNNSSHTSSSSRGYFNHNAVRVRPIPTTMEQVDEILAIARNLSTRTSAPAGWNPNAPVVGFSTPNPLPHQLRGGALAALELKRARQQQKFEQDQKKRKRQEEEEKAQKLKKESEYDNKQNTTLGMVVDATSLNDPKVADAASHRPSNRSTSTTVVVGSRTSTQQQSVLKKQHNTTTATMNLSDSSSSDDDNNDESE
jgi:hypothetical protein